MPVYKDEKTGTWFVKCYYTDYAGTRKQKKKRGFKLQREAKEWESQFLSSFKFNSKTTLKEIWDQFTMEMSPRQRITTQRGYTAAANHILPVFGHLPVSAITEQMLICWQNDILKKNYSENYLNKIDTNFRTVYRFGVKRCRLPFDVFSEVKKIGKQKRRSSFWTYEQYQAFYKVLCSESKNLTAKMAYQVLFYCGLRVGELLALTVGDVDLEKRVIHITKSLQRIHKEDVITPPKTEKGNRDINIPDFLADQLREYMGHIYGCNADSRLFDISKTTLYYPMRIYHEAAGVPRIHLHDLRHSHVAHLVEMGVSPMAIAERLGHESVNVTLGIYAHLYPNKQQEIADLLDRC